MTEFLFQVKKTDRQAGVYGGWRKELVLENQQYISRNKAIWEDVQA